MNSDKIEKLLEEITEAVEEAGSALSSADDSIDDVRGSIVDAGDKLDVLSGAVEGLSEALGGSALGEMLEALKTLEEYKRTQAGLAAALAKVFGEHNIPLVAGQQAKEELERFRQDAEKELRERDEEIVRLREANKVVQAQLQALRAAVQPREVCGAAD